VRVYLPTTLDALSGFVEAGEVPSVEERFVASDESEDAEYDALAAAAEAAAGLLSGRGRRVVVVAEVADADAAVPMDLVASVHADSEDVDPDAADLPELGWYAVQEIPDLLG
jgi:hypothetical protein